MKHPEQTCEAVCDWNNPFCTPTTTTTFFTTTTTQPTTTIAKTTTTTTIKTTTITTSSTSESLKTTFSETSTSLHHVPPQHYPLTPQTPTTNMSFPPCPPVGSESGYDTASSFYSSTPRGPEAGMLSPVPQHYDPSCNSPISYELHPSSEYHQYQHHSYYPQPPHNEANSEEDELLDVIAKWQET